MSESQIENKEINDHDQTVGPNNQLNDQDLEADRESRYKEGEELTMVRVRFPGNARSFPFILGKRTFSYGQKVVAMSDRGMDVGYINSFPYQIKFDKSMLPIRSISKIASQEDFDEQKASSVKSKEAWNSGNEVVAKLNLDMNITHVEIIQFGKKMVFYFTAPARVDFRELVKDLVGKLKTRIELRQISVRDRAAALGSIGPCGQMTCCSSFLKNYGSVSIKMAKNQNLALIPSKINGVCGQIKCCIKYEDDVYSEKRKKIPRENSIVLAANGDIGKVTRLHILAERFDMLTERGIIRRYSSSQFDPDRQLPEGYRFPQDFDSITTELDKVIGLSEELKVRSDQFIEDMDDEEHYDQNDFDSESDNDDEHDNNDDSHDSEQESEDDNNSMHYKATEQDQKANQPQRSDPRDMDQDKKPNGQGQNQNNKNRNRNRNRNRNKSKKPQ
ncbi:MAG: hypothetical protein COW00_15960 [Bdellovibrio sp. CG12_big_fil_rev_8_21_14_0_65_39_13]|nr:MAG: hypothetical protein COW78_02335 [Bdellovibrio sp. CG22_combo_CG10-13_8_21_14_all_39_27]PIQ58338.1 MAG: hypothetical protein COW00_15960 [Bdellovibrio sp. CG12_big_fil_rev_8_21_14_0_65_39_13]PIR35851.1 MAG: hypothetical protein COV37_06540 [Bdellovibrio sp. CG11_big_fil_rev_8_21_14_0_20_39_38]